MKNRRKNLFLALSSICILLFSVSNLNAQVTVSGAHDFSNGIYNTLKAAFDAINGQDQANNNIVVKITESTFETSSAILNGGEWTTLIIYPTTSGLSISGSLEAPLIDFNGAKKVTIDGRINLEGEAKDLTITNFSTSQTAPTSTIRFINSAQNNIIQYCTIKGSSLVFGQPASGVVFFSTSSTSGGNSNNTIAYCDITNANGNRPTNVIYSHGTNGSINQNNIISNNNFFNHHRYDHNSWGINISLFSTGFDITGNSFYETSSLQISSNSISIYPIHMGNNQGFVSISNNFFGGTEPQCGGSSFNIAGDGSQKNITYVAIYLSATGGTQQTNIENNVIRKIEINRTTSNNPFSFIWMNDANAGRIQNNRVGSEHDTESIKITTLSLNGNSFYGIIRVTLSMQTPFTHYIEDNFISSISIIPATNSNKPQIVGIKVSGGTNNTVAYIRNNLIGSTLTPNSISLGAVSGTLNLDAISVGLANGLCVISDNTITNLTNFGTGVEARVFGIRITTSAAYQINNNTISNLESASSNSGGEKNSSVFGIHHATGGSVNFPIDIVKNTIYNLKNTSTSENAINSVIGIYFEGSSAPNSISNIKNNFIHSLSLHPLNNNQTSTLTGILINNIWGTSGTDRVRNVYNNIVSLGNDFNNYCQIFGISELGNMIRTNNILFNTIYISGYSNGNAKTMALSIAGTGNCIRNIKNNIFVNERKNTGGNAKHYAIYITNNNGLSLDYNNYYTQETGGNLGYFNSEDINFLPHDFMGQNSVNKNPYFANPMGIYPNDYKPAVTNPLTIPGIYIAAFSKDFDDIDRLTPPLMGAFEQNATTEFNVIVNVSPDNTGTASGNGIYPQNSLITVNASPNEGYAFVNWTENNQIVSTDENYTFHLSTDRYLTANFTLTTALTELNYNFKVFPNPANDYICFTLPQEFINANISIIDAVGKTILKKELNLNMCVDISEIKTNGIYFYHIYNNDKNIINKFFIFK